MLAHMHVKLTWVHVQALYTCMHANKDDAGDELLDDEDYDLVDGADNAEVAEPAAEPAFPENENDDEEQQEEGNEEEEEQELGNEAEEEGDPGNEEDAGNEGEEKDETGGPVGSSIVAGSAAGSGVEAPLSAPGIIEIEESPAPKSMKGSIGVGPNPEPPSRLQVLHEMLSKLKPLDCITRIYSDIHMTSRLTELYTSWPRREKEARNALKRKGSSA